ncbi:nuclear RNA export factor 2 [Drosophila nasuta]|uniref:nuclear RNA export factor 2 n=1 Tax=Drosophila nasuta TaxID=42062 RepID=UPI00295E9D5D|nr:nuclear RNA export factor 2 [Drosophila nasuta]
MHGININKHRTQARIIDFGDRTQPIVVDYRNSRKYFKTKHYEGTPGLNWIEFNVHHEGALNFSTDPKQLILDALFKAIEGNGLFPVNYQCGQNVDTFLARTCKPALDKLFQRGLSIQTVSGIELQLSVCLNAAAYNRSQISPAVIISQVISRLMDNLETVEGVPGVLNLCNFKANESFKHVVVRLSNLATLQLVCSTIYNNDDNRRALKGFSFACNQISDLGPLKLFGDVDYDLLDLTYNRLSSAVRLCSDLQRVRAKHLKLLENPIAKKKQYPNCLEPLKTNFQIIDGVPFDKLYKMYTPLNYEIDVECDGTRIDWSNKSKLNEFKHSSDWHSFLIPDAQCEITKELLFDYISISLHPQLGEFYPCYYKFDGGEHRFLVRDCFDQIEHLVQTLNLELKIPELVNTLDDVQELNYERSIAYYLRMNVSSFKQGHVDPKQCIEQAVQKRFNAINRTLNLTQFQQTEGLEHVIVLLSSPKILGSILRMASRKFMGNCVDLRLGNNKIVSANNLRSLSLLSSLQALDLSQNWINDLSEISCLGDVPLKSLRLHGNPVCRKYSLPSEYIAAVTQIFSTLLKLDDVELSSKPGLTTQKDFLCNLSAYELTNEFLTTYLREFEQLDQRINMIKYYTENSIFTMTCSFDINRCARPSSELFKRINKYNYHSRNLIKNSLDTCRLSVGTNDIMAVLMQLPVVRHDYVSLQTDVMHYDANMIVINVIGLLRDEPDLLLAFSRQIVLHVDAVGLGIGKGARRLKIINERFNIMNPTRKQARDGFKFCELPSQVTVKQEHEEDSVDVKEHKLIIFQEITGLRPRWCTRIVQEEANWNFEVALQKFLEMQSGDELPNDAFA